MNEDIEQVQVPFEVRGPELTAAVKEAAASCGPFWLTHTREDKARAVMILLFIGRCRVSKEHSTEHDAGIVFSAVDLAGLSRSEFFDHALKAIDSYDAWCRNNLMDG